MNASEHKRFDAHFRKHLRALKLQGCSASTTNVYARPVSCHTLRYSFATDLLAAGYDIRTVQELMGHRDFRITRKHTHVIGRGGQGVLSPRDREMCQ